MRSVTPERLDANWRGVTAALDAPPLSLVERALRALRVSPSTARLAVSTPALRRAWFVASAVAMLFGLAAADPGRPRESLFTFLVLAPLVPAVGVALSYGPGSDPAYEITVSTPRSGLHLVLVRTLTIVVTSVAVLSCGSVLLPGRGATAYAWLVPAFALSATCLALMTVVPPRLAAVAVSVGWILVAGVVNRSVDDALTLFGGAAHAAFAALGTAASAIVVARRERFCRVGVRG